MSFVPQKVELNVEPEIVIPGKTTVIVTGDDGNKYTPTGYKLLGTQTVSTAKGIAMSGLEFAENNLPGKNDKDYKSVTLAEYERLAADGFNQFRVPFISTRFDDMYLGYIADNVDQAAVVGGKVWLDFHEYGKTMDTASRVLVAEQYKDNSTVECIEIDNEPHGGNVPDKEGYYDWVVDCVEAMRAAGWTKKIAIPMFDWSSMDVFADGQKDFVPPIIDDNVVYIFHNYFNKGNTGFNHPETPLETPQQHVERLQYVYDWSVKYGVTIAITEFGTPATDAWVDNALPFVELMKELGLAYFYWAAGDWYSSETTYRELHKRLLT